MENQSLFKEFENLFKEEAEPEKGKKEREYLYSPFALQDAVGEKSAKKAWIEYQKLVLQGIDPEDLVHKIVGKIRDLSAINAGASAADLGIKDFPYNKSKRDLKNWTAKSLEDFYTKLVFIHHGVRAGKEDLGLGLEKALLGL